MTLNDFIATAEAQRLSVRSAAAAPHGGWGPLRDVGHLFTFARLMVEDEEFATEDEALDMMLETELVVAVRRDDGAVVGAWSFTSHFINATRAVSLDDAAMRLAGY